MSALISVIVPAYNCGPWLPRCLDSLLAQSYPDLEILVVDDGSQDETWQILRDYSKRFSRIQAIHQENSGVTAARLKGVSLASGDWIGFVDADDWIEPQMYERLLSNALQYEADISHCGHQMVYQDKTTRYYYNTGVLRIQDRNTGIRDLLEETLVEPGLCNKLYRKSLFRGLGEKIPREIRNNEDLLMNYYLFSKAEKSIFEDVCPYHYMIRESSASRGRLNAHIIYDPIHVHEIIISHCEEEWKDDARRSLVQAELFAYAQLCRGMKKEYANDREKVRAMLGNQLPYWTVLPLKKAVMVWVVTYMPWVFHLVYGVYYFLKKGPRKG